MSLLKYSNENLEKEKSFESTVSVLQELVHYYQNQVNELKRENEELEQYGRSLCVRVDGIPSIDKEASD